jgi:hypothetical protein
MYKAPATPSTDVPPVTARRTATAPERLGVDARRTGAVSLDAPRPTAGAADALEPHWAAAIDAATD